MPTDLTPDERRELARLCGYAKQLNRDTYCRDGKFGHLTTFCIDSLDSLYRAVHAAGCGEQKLSVTVEDNHTGSYGRVTVFIEEPLSAPKPYGCDYTPPNLAPALARALLDAMGAKENK